MNKIPLSVVMLFMSIQSIAQTNFKIENNFLLFEDAYTKEPVLIYNDSTLATGFNFTNANIKTSFPKELKKNDFNFYQFAIQEKTYLVAAGCGPVVHYEDTKFTRVDKSFQHKSQFYAIPFQYKNEIYLWGGYGLFSYKNILTKYNFKTQEWGSMPQNFEKEIPPAQSSMIYAKTKDKVYILGGRTYDYENVFKSKYLEDLVWEFNLKTNTWKKIRKHNLQKFIKNKTATRKIIFQRKKQNRHLK